MENYLNEVYILRERLNSYLNKICKLSQIQVISATHIIYLNAHKIQKDDSNKRFSLLNRWLDCSLYISTVKT